MLWAVIAHTSSTLIPIVELGPLSLHGLVAGVGSVAGAALMLRELRRRGFDSDKPTSALTWALVAATSSRRRVGSAHGAVDGSSVQQVILCGVT